MKKESKIFGITSLICGVIGLLLVLMPYFGLPLAILAIVFANKQQSLNKSGLATAGNVVGIIGIVINGVMLLVVVFGLLFFSSLVGL